MADRSLPIGFVLRTSDRDYVVMDVLGKGGFGITYKVKSRVSVGNIAIDAFFAIKEFFPDFCWRSSDHATVLTPPTKTDEINEGLEDFIVEGQRLQQICKLNPNIVNVNEVFRANGTAYYVMEYLSGGDLRKLIKENGGGFSEATMMSILTPVASALKSVHSNMMLHLDIKPDNIVMRSGDDDTPDVPVLIDFGIAVHFKKDGIPTTKHPSKGYTPGYSSAEQYEGIKRFDPRLDIYALSATCYYMLTGHDPKSASEIEADDVKNELEGRASERTVKAITQGLSKDIGSRPATITQFMKLFKESNALPVGAIVKGQYQNCMILGVMEENESFIHYKATTAREDKETNITTQGTKRTLYDLWEYFVPGVHKRQQSGEVIAMYGERCPAWTLPNKLAGYAAANYGYRTSPQGIFETEYFHKGTEYLIVRQGYKPTPKWIKYLQSLWHKIKKPLLITVGGLALIAASGWLAFTLIDKKKQKHIKASTSWQREDEDWEEDGLESNSQSIDYENYNDALLEKAQSGDAKAQNSLGECYYHGHGVTKDYSEAVNWFRKAAQQGNADAQFKLGACYEEGLGVTQDYNEAVKWYRKAAEQGFAAAQKSLGECYEYGYGVAKDINQAVEWYRKAAELGYADAQDRLGYCYYSGEGVTQDYNEAVKWFRKAAEQGYAPGQHILADCYEKGNGVTKDINQAVEWYRKAARQGQGNAQDALKRLGYSW